MKSFFLFITINIFSTNIFKIYVQFSNDTYIRSINVVSKLFVIELSAIPT